MALWSNADSAGIGSGGNQTIDHTFQPDGTVLYDAPGFENYSVPTITCTNVSATSERFSAVREHDAPCSEPRAR